MTRITTCPPCQIGDHKRHYRTVQAVPEGVYGGSVCTCKGECEANAPELRKKFLSRVWGGSRRV